MRGAVFVESDVTYTGDTRGGNGWTDCVPYDGQCCTLNISWSHKFVLKLWIGDQLAVDYVIGQALARGEMSDDLLEYHENISGNTFYGSAYFHINEKTGIITIALPKTSIGTTTTYDLSQLINGQRVPDYRKRVELVHYLNLFTNESTYNFCFQNYNFGYYPSHHQSVTKATPEGRKAADDWLVFIYDINLNMLSDVTHIVNITHMFNEEGTPAYWDTDTIYSVNPFSCKVSYRNPHFVKAGLIRHDELIKI